MRDDKSVEVAVEKKELHSNDKVFTYKYGQVLVSKSDQLLEKTLSGKEIIIPKGSEVIIGFDGLAHYLRDGTVQAFDDKTKILGFASNGLIEIIMRELNMNLPITEILSDYDLSLEQLREIISGALQEIGLYEE